MNTFQTLKERGFVRQVTGAPEKLEELLGGGPVVFYIGFDPTADSLHCGSLLPVMTMAHLQRLGHKPIAVLGAGTAMVGDPSGKTEMRKMLTKEEIERNGRSIEAQLRRYLQLDGKQGWLVNNADWLLQLGYVEFLRDIGKYFRVFIDRYVDEEGLFLHRIIQTELCDENIGGETINPVFNG